MTVTFLHTSDLQIGMIRWFLDSDAQARFDDARINAITRLGAIAEEMNCEFIVMSGDVFEHNSLEKKTSGRALEALKKLPVPVYLLSGNHDPLVADSLFYQAENMENVHVLSDSSPVEVRRGVEIVGAPLTTKRATYDVLGGALGALTPTDAIRIAVGHGQTEARTNDIVPDLINLDLAESKLADASVDYIALGDTHSTQAVGETGRMWYSGAPETTDFYEVATGGGETDSGNVLVVTAGKGTAEVAKIPCGAWIFEALTVSINSQEEAEAFISTLETYPDKSTTVIKYALQGTVSLATMKYLEQEIARLQPIFAALYERPRLMDFHVEPSEEELSDLGLYGFAKTTLEELAAADNQTARDAVNLLFRLSKEQ
ncbi:metallophosphoesterase family protein [Corynebacterium ulcerans]|uniref:Nuclease SbcCD subunit D n=1 Tax=Corynebacterium ulcerans TaxID=65058 RepID=A0ABD0BJS3_CORUL|nr:metallophosphoesterase [Corynebacterium ulcerans]AIT88863.1 Exonuclease, SbcD-family [Corynebacterium ulcerans]ALD94639.1 Exonuclease, SbcD-family [Corynebacterium ulcerans]KPH76888.1 DNA repair exonuclease [Corynebacterium ulcerans]MBH5301882.1 metallophosphoesterase [Corynebacterium ulcerans]MBL4944035.1 metallophosphoesterase [Corynebacterium ulcerans]